MDKAAKHSSEKNKTRQKQKQKTYTQKTVRKRLAIKICEAIKPRAEDSDQREVGQCVPCPMLMSDSLVQVQTLEESDPRL